MSEAARPLPRRPRLRTILLAVNLLILALPLAGIGALRLYEDELVQGTEAQLLVLGAALRDLFVDEYASAAPEPGPGRPAEPPSPDGAVPAAEPEPLLPRLQIARETIRPPAPPPTVPGSVTDAAALTAGARIMPALARSARRTLIGVRIVDASGIVVASSRGELGLSLAAREEVRRALAGEEISLLRERRSDEAAPAFESLSRGQRYRVFVALPVRHDGRVVGAVVLSRTPLDIAKALWLRRRGLGIAGAAVLVVVVLVSVLTALTISRPVHALIRQAERVVRGERGALVEIPGPGTHEVARLSRALAAMAATLEQRGDYIREFAARVSHEFKTPLTTLRGTSELLGEHWDEMDAAERGRFLSNLREAAARLDRLVRRLLELARADVLRPAESTADLRAVAAAAVHRYRETGLDVRFETPAGESPLPVRVAPEIVDEILGNLLDNARQHGGPGVRVTVSVAPDPARPGVARLAVDDDGPGISPANAARIFTPFFTTDRAGGGSGLGLAIVRSLVEAHGGRIALDGQERGARFVLELPGA